MRNLQELENVDSIEIVFTDVNTLEQKPIKFDAFVRSVGNQMYSGLGDLLITDVKDIAKNVKEPLVKSDLGLIIQGAHAYFTNPEAKEAMQCQGVSLWSIGFDVHNGNEIQYSKPELREGVLSIKDGVGYVEKQSFTLDQVAEGIPVTNYYEVTHNGESLGEISYGTITELLGKISCVGIEYSERDIEMQLEPIPVDSGKVPAYWMMSERVHPPRDMGLISIEEFTIYLTDIAKEVEFTTLGNKHMNYALGEDVWTVKAV
jgi:hypothetical protein